MATKQKSIDRGIALPYSFIVPDDLPESGTAINNYHSWELILSSKGGEIMLKRAFLLPFVLSNNAHENVLKNYK